MKARTFRDLLLYFRKKVLTGEIKCEEDVDTFVSVYFPAKTFIEDKIFDYQEFFDKEDD